MQIDHLVIYVRSLQDSVPWYETLFGLLGLEKSRDHIWGNEQGVYLDLREARPGTRDYDRFGPGLNHTGFRTETRSEHERVREGMAAAGFEVPDTQTFGDDVSTFFKDPDGMRVELASPGETE